jgi:hypothetical protein
LAGADQPKRDFAVRAEFSPPSFFTPDPLWSKKLIAVSDENPLPLTVIVLPAWDTGVTTIL